ncbi:hypothetical protein EL22_28490 [Halostagnicola sp. A56]|uniref:hypothetical protein n=1 Tax=Halostagnicola sp. A56 TaxID=1495067 RepID=UPI00065F6A28|nr:hypothetical protein [Halostagnicola sp. A56]KMT45681.1 hypothetical protein EL22_28490 [Halostagnicola sp. A56]
MQNSELARDVWPDYEEQSAGSDDATDPYEYLIFLEKAFEVEISSKELHSYAGYDQNYPISFIPLHDRGLEAIKKEYGSIEAYLEAHQSNPTIWIEKTQIAGRPYKQDGQYELGKALMSPSRDKGGGKRYEAMRKAEIGDLVLHLLQEQHQIVGISVIESNLVENFEGPPTDRWTEKQQEEGGYLRCICDTPGTKLLAKRMMLSYIFQFSVSEIKISFRILLNSRFSSSLEAATPSALIFCLKSLRVGRSLNSLILLKYGPSGF